MPPEGTLKEYEVRRIAKALLFAPTDCPDSPVLFLHGILVLMDHPALTEAIKAINPEELIAALNTPPEPDNAFADVILQEAKDDARRYASAIVAVAKMEKSAVKTAVERLCRGPSSPFPSETAANADQAWELLAALVETASGKFKISVLRAIVVAIYGPDSSAVQLFDRLQPSIPGYNHDSVISKWKPILGNTAADEKDISDGVVRPSVSSTRLRSWRTALQYLLEDAGIPPPVCLLNIFRAIATAPLVAGVRWDPLTHAAGRLSMAQAMATLLPSHTPSSVGSGTGPDLVTRAVLYRLPVLSDISLVSAVIAAADSTPAESYDLMGQDVIILRASGAPVLELPAFLLGSFTPGQPGQLTPGGARCTDLLALPQGQPAAAVATRTFSSTISGLYSLMEDGTLPANSDSGARLLQLLLTIRRTTAQTTEMEQLMSDMSTDTWEKVIDHFTKVLDKEISKRYITMVQFLANRPADGAPEAPASPAAEEVTTMLGDVTDMSRTVQMLLDQGKAHGKQLELLQIIMTRLITLIENGQPLDKAVAEALANNPPPRTDEQRLEGLRNMVANDVVPTFGAHRTSGVGAVHRLAVLPLGVPLTPTLHPLPRHPPSHSLLLALAMFLTSSAAMSVSSPLLASLRIRKSAVLHWPSAPTPSLRSGMLSRLSWAGLRLGLSSSTRSPSLPVATQLSQRPSTTCSRAHRATHLSMLTSAGTLSSLPLLACRSPTPLSSRGSSRASPMMPYACRLLWHLATCSGPTCRMS
jgi:hypothetical protein